MKSIMNGENLQYGRRRQSPMSKVEAENLRHEISGFHGGEYEDDSFLGYSAV
jgi:hypothetical protein